MSRTGISPFIRNVGSFSYTPRAGICLVIRWLGSLSYTTRPGICLEFGEWKVSFTFPVLESVSSTCGWGDFLKRPVL